MARWKALNHIDLTNVLRLHVEQEFAYGTDTSTSEAQETDTAETSKEVLVERLHILGCGGRTNQGAFSRPERKRRYQLAVL
jgi:hypothetical protein